MWVQVDNLKDFFCQMRVLRVAIRRTPAASSEQAEDGWRARRIGSYRSERFSAHQERFDWGRRAITELRVGWFRAGKLEPQNRGLSTF